MQNLFLVGVLVAPLISACATPPTDRPDPVSVLSEAQIEQGLASNFRTLQDVSIHLDELENEFRNFQEQGAWKTRGYFSASEADALEFLLFRSVALQTTLWDMLNSYGGLNAQFSSDETETRAHVLSIAAALLLSGHAAFVVAEFADDPVAVGQMNQAYYRSELAAGRSGLSASTTSPLVASSNCR
ncbi:MAG: hypothetical protein JRJ58_23615 [Deltaproteobacteria bacterium]|nr:hypothetical protein [Deltaproteobacteria bacterium]